MLYLRWLTALKLKINILQKLILNQSMQHAVKLEFFFLEDSYTMTFKR